MNESSVPALASQAVALPTPATIHDAQNADQKEAVIPGAIQIATYTKMACPTSPVRRTASQPIRVATSVSAGRNSRPKRTGNRGRSKVRPGRVCAVMLLEAVRPQSPMPRTTPATPRVAGPDHPRVDPIPGSSPGRFGTLVTCPQILPLFDTRARAPHRRLLPVHRLEFDHAPDGRQVAPSSSLEESMVSGRHRSASDRPDLAAYLAASGLWPARHDGHADLVGAQHEHLAGR